MCFRVDPADAFQKCSQFYVECKKRGAEIQKIDGLRKNANIQSEKTDQAAVFPTKAPENPIIFDLRCAYCKHTKVNSEEPTLIGLKNGRQCLQEARIIGLWRCANVTLEGQFGVSNCERYVGL